MKEVEKLDTVLRQLYEQSHKVGGIRALLAEKSIFIELDEAFRLVKRLEKHGYVSKERMYTYDTDVTLRLESEGMEFVEGDSFTRQGAPIVNNHYNTTISNSTNANIISHSNQTAIIQHYNAESKQLLDQMREAVANDKKITEQQRQAVIDCVDDVEAGIDAGRVPKVSLKQLLETGAEISSISSLVLKLTEVLNHIS